MSSEEVRRGFARAKFNDEYVNIVLIEILILSIIFGFFYKSWFVGGGILLGSFIAIQTPYLSIFFTIVMSMFWSLITAALINSKTTDSLLNHFDTTEIFINQIIYVLNGIISIYSKDSSLVIGGIVFLISFGLHLSAVEWAKDMS